MDRDVTASYPRHYTFHASPAPRPTLPFPLGRYNQYSSDPTLIDSDSRDDETESSRGGRRSAQGGYVLSEENQNLGQQARKVKKKKLRRLKSFVHVFLGGLRRSDTIHGDKDVISLTRYQQRDERNGVARSVSQDGNANTTAEQRNERQKGAPRLVLPRIPNGEIPGLCGLYNHGNTCFMNAVLQCLSNTDQLAEYFVTDQYKNDVNKHKGLRKFGPSSDVTEQLAILLKCLWNGQYDPRVTARFKDVVGRHASQYQGTSQHDAQEFFLWLLDNVHEDLNQAGKKKYRAIKDSVGRPDEEVAAETLASHQRRNNSFIQNLFQGQFRSALICPSCSARSCTFDPYVCISVPLPQRESRPIYVTVVYRSAARKSRVFGVNVSIDSSIRELRNKLAELCGVSRYHLVLTDLVQDGFHRTFYDDQHISVIHGGDLMFAFECPPYRGDNPEAQTPANPSGSKELLLLLVVNKIGQTQYGKRFGPPLILRIWRDLTHSQFQSVVLKSMARYLREGVKLADMCRSGVLFQCKVVDGLPGRSILPTDVDHPFYSPSVDKAVNVSMLYGCPAHIKVVAEWELETKAHVFGVLPNEIPEPHESVTELRQLYQKPLEASLNDCLQIYTREEILNREDSWFCPHCKRQQQNATKKINLWTLPDVLVIHLKRFRHIGYCRTKLNTLVKFPISGLDMTPYLTNHHQRPSSAADYRKTSRTSRTLPSNSKSVRFEDESSLRKPAIGRSVSTGGTKFPFPWRKRSSKQERSRSPDPPRVVYSPPLGNESPTSVRSAPSTVGHATRKAHSPQPSDFRGQLSRASSLEDSRLDNVYDLYAVCNHLGTMSRGHYTSYCRNPADGSWYMFDDIHVRPITEEQITTQGAYMLFYIRQSLLVQSPLSSSESSTSSGSSSNHWIYHIPQFTLDLSSYEEEEEEGKSEPRPRPRLGSANSSLSAPPNSESRVSPSYSAHDNESDVFASLVHTPHVPRHISTDTRSAVSLPPYNPNVKPYTSNTLNMPRAYHRPPSYEHAVSQSLSSPTHSRLATSGHYPSLPLAKVRHASSTGPASPTEGSPLRRGRSFNSPRHQSVQRSETLPGRYGIDYPVPHSQPPVMPSRSIPNVSTEMSPWLARAYTVQQSETLPGRYGIDYPVPHSQPPVMPSRSIPNVSTDMSPQLARAYTDDPSVHFMTPQPRHRSASYTARAHTLTRTGSRSNPPTESCV